MNNSGKLQLLGRKITVRQNQQQLLLLSAENVFLIQWDVVRKENLWRSRFALCLE